VKHLELLLALLAALPKGALAAQDETPVLVKVGAWSRLDLPFAVAAGVCNDPTIVRTEARNGALGVLGLKTGRTTCGYWATPASRHYLFDVTVVP
jgi:hypothetical protein